MSAPADRPAPRLLLVDDEEAVREVTAAILRQGAYEVLTAGSAAEALALAASHPGPIGLLVADLIMPRVGGRELAARLRQALPGLRVLYLSGDDPPEGLDAPFLDKPFDPARLLARVAELFGTDTPS